MTAYKINIKSKTVFFKENCRLRYKKQLQTASAPFRHAGRWGPGRCPCLFSAGALTARKVEPSVNLLFYSQNEYLQTKSGVQSHCSSQKCEILQNALNEKGIKPIKRNTTTAY